MPIRRERLDWTTPYCITVDFETLEDECVTIRDRDSLAQVRLPIAEVANYLNKHISFSTLLG